MTESFSVLIAAMGGEGGGVLADWLVDAATQMNYPVQSTSVPGVAQRTGATTYYVEIYPVSRSELQGAEPVLSLTPTPGEVNLLAASELVEAGRAVQNGFVTKERTVLVASAHREYAVVEKSAMGDGRYDSQRLIEAAQSMARSCGLFDMRELAIKNGTVINTVLFGAMARLGGLPFPREVCETAIRNSGKAVEASLRGFAAGYEWQGHSQTEDAQTQVRHVEAIANVRPDAMETQKLIAAGIAYTKDYQDQAYADLYKARVKTVQDAESGWGSDLSVTRETARYLALWMSFDDVIRIADLKTRKERLEKVRQEVGAKTGEPLHLTEFLKPGLDELCSVLPPKLAAKLRARFKGKRLPFSRGLHLPSHTVSGFMMLVVLRSLRPMRKRMSRYALEQEAIERWLLVVKKALNANPQLALEVAKCGNLVKGYGETSERGHRNISLILDDVEKRLTNFNDWTELTARVRSAREAALGDAGGGALAQALGLPRPALAAQPIRFFPKRPAN